jgi:MerR family regulatory protein
MLSVTQLAHACGLSRTTVLYYESLGLLPAPPRSKGNFRQFGDKHLSCLRQICSYRSSGLKLGPRLTPCPVVGSTGGETITESERAPIGRKLPCVPRNLAKKA